jgi:hypothetical protein
MIPKSEWVWMPHAAHFIAGDRCSFKLATKVGNHIISTVGELKYVGNENGPIEEIGWGRKYETMVFKAKKSSNKCCPWVQYSGSEIDMTGYNDAASAYRGHIKMCMKYAQLQKEKTKMATTQTVTKRKARTTTATVRGKAAKKKKTVTKKRKQARKH